MAHCRLVAKLSSQDRSAVAATGAGGSQTGCRKMNGSADNTGPRVWQPAAALSEGKIHSAKGTIENRIGLSGSARYSFLRESRRCGWPMHEAGARSVHC